MCTVPGKFRHFAAKVKGGIPWQIWIDVFGGARFLAKKRESAFFEEYFWRSAYFRSKEKCIFWHFFCQFFFSFTYFPPCWPRFPFAAFASLIARPVAPMYIISPPVLFLVSRPHVFLSSPTSGATYFCQWAPGPLFYILSSFRHTRKCA